MSDFATKNAVMGMVEQILPGMVREKMFDFNACAVEIENEFGIVMTIEEIRLAFAKLELKNTTIKDSNEYDKHEVPNNDDKEESQSESESDEEEYNSYPNRFGNRQQRRQQQQASSTINNNNDTATSTSSWLSFDQNQEETKEEKDVEDDNTNNNNPRAPSTSTNIRPYSLQN